MILEFGQGALQRRCCQRRYLLPGLPAPLGLTRAVFADERPAQARECGGRDNRRQHEPDGQPTRGRLTMMRERRHEWPSVCTRSVQRTSRACQGTAKERDAAQPPHLALPGSVA